ncbi:hypothetical protein D3C72_2084490 [compost metagenome]
MKQDHCLLFVACPILGSAYDQGSGEQVLFLERMGMHPMRSALSDRKFVLPDFLGLQ